MGQIIYVLAVLTPITFFFHRYFLRSNHANLPPGPKGLPIIGNLKDLPPKDIPEYQHWLKHKDTYGPISSLTVLGQTLVVLHDRRAVSELMDKMSLQTSSRPHMEFALELCGFDQFISSQQYNATLRKYRKFVHQQLGTKALSAQFDDIQEMEVDNLLIRMLETPEHLTKHFRTLAGAIILKMTYGYALETDEVDPLVRMIEHMANNFSRAFTPGSWAVDLVPALKYLPDWFPGAGFKATARHWKDINQAVADVPFSFVRSQMSNEKHRSSYVSKLIHQCGKEAELKLDVGDELAIKWTAATLYAGGADTTVASLRSFILAMLLFPDVQKKAQDELDKVVGSGILPLFKDRPNLPYVEGVVKESLRWNPVAPMGLPHTTDEDITYDGHFIPKGSILLPAVWWLTHDPETYRDPDMFDPERYLPPRMEPDPTVVFGLGRRICPGRYFAEAGAFISIANILAAFTIERDVDDHGASIDVKLAVTPGILANVLDFRYKIRPRSAKLAEQIRATAASQRAEASDAHLLRIPQSLADL